MGFDNAYESLIEENAVADNRQWAFGAGFDDPLAGVETAVPEGVDAEDLATYCLMLGDDALVMAQRLTEWVAHAPEMEIDVALANTALDLLGQARLLLARAGRVGGSTRTEDALAYFRDAREFRNVRLVELSRTDFATEVAVLVVFASWRLAVLRRLVDSHDPVLAAIAGKGVRELTYQRDYAAQWLVVLGDGTEVSAERMRRAMELVWPYVDELFRCHDVERRMTAAGIAVDPSWCRAEFDEVIVDVLAAAGLQQPEVPPVAGVSGRAGRDGVHTEGMGHLLAEMQSLARAHPEGVW